MTRDFEGEVKREDLVEMAHGNQMFSLEEKKIAFLKIATKQATNAPCTSKKKHPGSNPILSNIDV